MIPNLKRQPETDPAMTRAILDAVPHPVFTVSADGRVAEANMAAEAFFQVSAPLLRRRPFTELVPFVLVVLACLMVVTYFPALTLTLRDLVYR